MDYMNILLFIIFGFLAVWMLMGIVRTSKQITIKDKLWTFNRILFLLAGIFAMLSVFVYNSIWDVLRLFAMMAAIIGFLLMRDGIGDEGFVTTGTYVPYIHVKNYDYALQKKKFTVYFVYSDPKGKGKDKGVYNASIDFHPDDQEEIKKLLKERIGRKYMRMKKN
jgi:hypothetical protein